MKYYLKTGDWFFKDYFGDIEQALWVKDPKEAVTYTDFNEANRAASELQVLIEEPVSLVLV